MKYNITFKSKLLSKLYATLIAMLAVCTVAMAQAPANDNPAGALPIAVNGVNCTPTVAQSTLVSNVNATATTLLPAFATLAVCNSSGIIPNDVWYSFVAPASGRVHINTLAGTTSDPTIQVYSGPAAGPLVPIACDGDGGVLNLSFLAVGNLVPGNVYFIRVFDWGNTPGNINLNIVNPVTACTAAANVADQAPPANDSPCTAITLTPGVNTCTSTSGTLNNATGDFLGGLLLTTPGATGTGPDIYASDPCYTISGTGHVYRDVWYSFVAPANGRVSLATSGNSVGAGGTLNNNPPAAPVTAPVTAITNLAMQVFANASCAAGVMGALTEVYCSDDAITPTTGGLFPRADLDNLTPNATYLVRISSKAEGSLAAPATSGGGNFNICFTTRTSGTNGPANDAPCGAIPLTWGAACVNTLQTPFASATNYPGTTVNGSLAITPLNPSCFLTGLGLTGTNRNYAANNNSDVWFSFTPTAASTGNVRIKLAAGATTDLVAQIFSGNVAACPAYIGLTQIACNDNQNPSVVCPAVAADANYPNLDVYNLAIGTTYYVRVFNKIGTNAVATNFNICWTTAPPEPYVANDEPCSAEVPVAAAGACPAVFDTYSVLGATATTAATSGITTVPAIPVVAPVVQGGDIWMRFVVPTANPSVIINTSVTGASNDFAFALYRIPCGATCPNLSSLTIIANSTTIGGSTVATMPSVTTNQGGTTPTLLPGEVVYVRLFAQTATPASCPTTVGLCISQNAVAAVGVPEDNLSTAPDITASIYNATNAVYFAGGGAVAPNANVTCTPSNATATLQCGEPVPPIAGGASGSWGQTQWGTAAGQTLWYKFTVPAGGDYYVSTDNTAACAPTLNDTQLALWRSSDGTSTGNFTLIADNDDMSSGSLVNTLRAINYSCGNLAAGTYYAQLDGFGMNVGNFALSVVKLIPLDLKACLVQVGSNVQVNLTTTGGLVAGRSGFDNYQYSIDGGAFTTIAAAGATPASTPTQAQLATLFTPAGALKFGKHTFTVRDSRGCTKTIELDVQPTAHAGQDIVACVDCGDIQLKGAYNKVGGNTGTWSIVTGTGTLNNAVATSASGASYTPSDNDAGTDVTLRLTSEVPTTVGCVAQTDDIVISFLPKVMATTTYDTICSTGANGKIVITPVTKPAALPAGFKIQYSTNEGALWADLPASNEVTGLAPGCQTLQLRTNNAGGTKPSPCIVKRNLVIYPDVSADAAIASVVKSATCGTADVTDVTFGGVANTYLVAGNADFLPLYSYSTNGGAFSAYSKTLPTGLAAGCYQIKVKPALKKDCGDNTVNCYAKTISKFDTNSDAQSKGGCESKLYNFVVYPAKPVLTAPANACNAAFTQPSVTAVTPCFKVEYTYNLGAAADSWVSSSAAMPIVPGCYTVKSRFVKDGDLGVAADINIVADGAASPAACVADGVNVVIFPEAPTAPSVSAGCGTFTVTPPTAVTGFKSEYSFDDGGTWGMNTPPTADNCAYKVKTRYVTDGVCGTVADATAGTGACASSPATTRTVDTANPTASNPATIALVGCGTAVPPSDITAVTDEADNCTAMPTVAFVSDVVATAGCVETTTRTYSVTDACLNTINVTQMITRTVDMVVPTASNPATIALAGCGAAVPPSDITAVTDEADNCTAVPTVAFVSDAVATAGCVETTTRTYSVTDACMNTINVTQMITRTVDMVVPTASNPATIALVGCGTAVPPSDITAVTDEADNCTAMPTVAFVSDVVATAGCVETTTRTYSVTDACLNTINVTQMITRTVDMVVPTASNPATIALVGCGAAVPPSDITAVTDEADNCTAVPTVAFVSDAVATAGCVETTTRTYSVTDACMNTINVTQMITRTVDMVVPTASNPATIALVGCGAAVPPSDITAVTDEADNCTAVPTVAFVSDAVATAGCVETTTRTYSVTDACMNTINVTQMITRTVDMVVPTASNPATIALVGCGAAVPAPNVMAVTDEADNCTAMPTVAFVSDAVATAGCVETTTRTYSVTDACMNTINVTQMITRTVDMVVPTASNPATIALVGCGAAVPPSDITAVTDEADNCTAMPTVAFVSDAVATAGCVETTTRTYSVTDACLNTINVTQMITRTVDMVVPTASNPATIALAGCGATVPAPNVMAVTDEADNCTAVPTVAFVSDAVATAGCVETTTRTYSVTDACMNTINVTQMITRTVDMVVPTASNPATIALVGCGAAVPAPNVMAVTDEADNCTAMPTVAFVSDAVATAGCVETTTRTYSVTDACLNTINVTQMITRTVDMVVPTASNPATIALAGCGATVPAPNVMAVTDEADNCTAMPTVAFVSDAVATAGCVETTTRTYSVTDACMNTINVTQMITRTVDMVVPTASNPATIALVGCGAAVPAPNVMAVTDEADNCTAMPTVAFVSDAVATAGCVETTTRTYSVTDACMNTINVTQMITRTVDMVVPTASNPATIGLVGCGAAVPAPNVMAVTDEADNCTAMPTVAFVSDAVATAGCVETTTRTYSVTDACMNTINVTQMITRTVDMVVPTASNPATIALVGCGAAVPPSDITAVTDEADNCTAMPTVAFVSDVVATAGCVETTTRTYSVTDACMNTINVTQMITRTVDMVVPTASNPATIALVGCGAAVPAPNVMAVTDEADNCTAMPTVAFVSDVVATAGCVETTTRTYSVTDACMNTINVTQMITRTVDMVVPTASNPATIALVGCGAAVPAPNVTAVTDEADNCTAVPTVAFVSDAVATAGCVETTTRTYSVTDACLNTINVTQMITRTVDMVVPTANTIPTTMLACGTTVPAPDITRVTGEADNCTAVPTVTVLGTSMSATGGTQTTTYTYRVTDDCNNFIDVQEIYTVGTTVPILSTTAMPNICASTNYNLATVPVTDASGLSGTLSYHSGTPATAANELASPNVSPTTATTYYIKKTATNGCSSQVPVSITVRPLPVNDGCAGALPLTATPGQANGGQTAQDMTCATQDMSNNPTFTGAGCGGTALANNPVYYSLTTDGFGGTLSIELNNATFPAGSSLRAGVFAAGCGASPAQTGGCATFTAGGTQTISGLLANTTYVLVLDAMPAGSPIIYDIKLPNTGALSVNLLSFTGRNVNTKNILNWVTKNELNNDRFEVERSTDGSFFEAIGSVKGRGTTNLTSEYIFADDAPYNGANFYRLRQIDFDGKATYSKIILINVKSDRTAIVNVRPNPTTSQLYYSIYTPISTNGVATITDMLGRVVYTQSVSLLSGYTNMEFDAENLAAGSYMITLRNANGVSAHKQFVKTDR